MIETTMTTGYEIKINEMTMFVDTFGNKYVEIIEVNKQKHIDPRTVNNLIPPTDYGR